MLDRILAAARAMAAAIINWPRWQEFVTFNARVFGWFRPLVTRFPFLANVARPFTLLNPVLSNLLQYLLIMAVSSLGLQYALPAMAGAVAFVVSAPWYLIKQCYRVLVNFLHNMYDATVGNLIKYGNKQASLWNTESGLPHKIAVSMLNTGMTLLTAIKDTVKSIAKLVVVAPVKVLDGAISSAYENAYRVYSKLAHRPAHALLRPLINNMFGETVSTTLDAQLATARTRIDIVGQEIQVLERLRAGVNSARNIRRNEEAIPGAGVLNAYGLATDVGGGALAAQIAAVSTLPVAPGTPRNAAVGG